MEVDLISVGSADSEERVFLVENRRDPIDGSFDTVERDLLMDCDCPFTPHSLESHGSEEYGPQGIILPHTRRIPFIAPVRWDEGSYKLGDIPCISLQRGLGSVLALQQALHSCEAGKARTVEADGHEYRLFFVPEISQEFSPDDQIVACLVGLSDRRTPNLQTFPGVLQDTLIMGNLLLVFLYRHPEQHDGCVFWTPSLPYLSWIQQELGFFSGDPHLLR